MTTMNIRVNDVVQYDIESGDGNNFFSAESPQDVIRVSTNGSQHRLSPAEVRDFLKSFGLDQKYNYGLGLLNNHILSTYRFWESLDPAKTEPNDILTLIRKRLCVPDNNGTGFYLEPPLCKTLTLSSLAALHYADQTLKIWAKEHAQKAVEQMGDFLKLSDDDKVMVILMEPERLHLARRHFEMAKAFFEATGSLPPDFVLTMLPLAERFENEIEHIDKDTKNREDRLQSLRFDLRDAFHKIGVAVAIKEPSNRSEHIVKVTDNSKGFTVIYRSPAHFSAAKDAFEKKTGTAIPDLIKQYEEEKATFEKRYPKYIAAEREGFDRFALNVFQEYGLDQPWTFRCGVTLWSPLWCPKNAAFTVGPFGPKE